MDIKETINRYLLLQSQNKGIILGGSAALILQGIISPRDVKDLDVCLPYFYFFKDSNVKTEALSRGKNSYEITIPDFKLEISVEDIPF